MNPNLSDEQLDRIYARQLQALADEVSVPSRMTFAVARPYAPATGMPARTLALVGLLVGVTVALAWTMAIVGQSPSPPMTFPLGSIAFARGGDLYVAGPDGSGSTLIATSAGGLDPMPRFAFSPDRTSLAYTRVNDATKPRDLVIVDANGQTLGTYEGSAPPEMSRMATIFGWAPDSQSLAIYPAESEADIAIVARDGGPIKTLSVSDVAVATPAWSSLAWSPDGSKIAVPIDRGPHCADGLGDALCYVLIATDGSGITDLGRSALAGQASPAELAWAPDGGYALAHRGPSDGYLGSVASVEIRSGNPGDGYIGAPLPEHITAVAGRTLAWSPDGSLLAAATVDDRLGPVFYLFDDGNDRRLPMNPLPVSETISMVTWSPDGSQLMFATHPVDGVDLTIWSVGLPGGMPTKVVDANGLIFDVAGAALNSTQLPTVEVRPS